MLAEVGRSERPNPYVPAHFVEGAVTIEDVPLSDGKTLA